MSKEKDKIYSILENIAITFDEMGFAPTIPIPKGNKKYFKDWFSFEIKTIKELIKQRKLYIKSLELKLEEKDKEIENLSAECEKHKRNCKQDNKELAIEELEDFQCWLDNNTAWGEPINYKEARNELEQKIILLKEKK